MKKNTKMFQGFCPQLPLGLCHRPVVELTAPQDTHLHFIVFKNSIFVQKGTLVKLLREMLTSSIINSCYSHNDWGCTDLKGLANRIN